METEEFIELQRQLLQHKKNYYINNSPTITDQEYDLLEKKSFSLAQELGFRADAWLDAEENEKHHIHWMVGYSENSIYED